MEGLVFSGTTRVTTSGCLLAADCQLELRKPKYDFVSRGGIKLEYALKQFNINAQSMIALDIGASTGGFTDVLLAHGASRVYAVDVGYGQLAWKLRRDPRVIVLERTNARYLNTILVPDLIELLVCDASFIGLRALLPASLALCRPGAIAVALIKPQFEARRAHVGKNGVVRDPDIHSAIIFDIQSWWNNQPGWEVTGVAKSPITGPKGNKEFLITAHLKS